MKKLLIHILVIFIITLNSCVFYTHPFYDGQCGVVVDKYYTYAHYNSYHNYPVYYLTIKDDCGCLYNVVVSNYTYHNTYRGEYVCLE